MWTIILAIISLILLIPLFIILKSIKIYPTCRYKYNNEDGEFINIPYWSILAAIILVVIPVLNIIGAILAWAIYISQRCDGSLEYISYTTEKWPTKFQNIVKFLNKTI